MGETDRSNEMAADGISRRRLLGGALGVTGAASVLGLGGVLSACGSDDSSTSSSTGAAGKVSRGGTLRVAMIGGGPSAKLDPSSVLTLTAFARIKSIFEPLADFTREEPLVLAESLEPSADLKTWQVKLRKGVTFHDGSPLTADDVLFSYRRLVELEAAYLPALDLKRSKRVSDHELLFVLNYPVAELTPVIFNGTNTFIVQEGAKDFTSPVGTGPFKFSSYRPGEDSVFKANPDYWRKGLPYVDELVIQDIDDPAARMNALLAGQVDAVSELDLRVASGLLGGGADTASSGILETNDPNVRIVNGAAGQWVPFCLDMASEEFSDPRVREAFRLAIDREQAVDSALSGLGIVGNDLFGINLPGYASEIEQRTYDPEKARSLLKAAGREGMTIELPTAPAGTAFVEASRVFASSAKAAGIDIKVKTVPADSYFTAQYLKVPMFQTQWVNATLLDLAPAILLSDAPYNAETNWKEPAWDKEFEKAQGTADQASRDEILVNLQQALWDRGGYLIWGMPNWVDGIGPTVNGIKASSRLSLGGFQFDEIWLS